MKKINIIFLYLINFLPVVGQQQTKTLEYEFTDYNGYSFKSALFINGNESLYILNDSRTTGSYKDNQGGYYKITNDKWSKVFYSKNNTSVTRIPLSSKEIIYSSDNNDLKYTILKNTKNIGKFKCQEIKVQKGGREYSVWITKEVQLTNGPLNLHNLPGMVVEINDVNEPNFKIKLLKYSSKIIEPDKYESYKKYISSKKPMSTSEYNKLVSNYMKNKKKEIYAFLANESKNGQKASMEFKEDQSYFTVHLIDIPPGLISELQKIKQ